MYSNKLIVAVKSNGKVLREQGDTVFLPFGQEFTILVKNKNSLRCLVRIEIDGVDATENTSLIVPANGEVELERFIKNRNFESGNRFKFIERTASIENGPRGIKVDDGLIRVEFEFEREAAPIKSPSYDYFDWNNPYRRHDFICKSAIATQQASPLQNSILRSHSVSSLSVEPASRTSMNYFDGAAQALYSAEPDVSAQVVNNVGITVPGSVSDQKFTQGAWFPTDGVKHVMILKMLGETAQGKQVKEPVTVKSKPKCVTCGHTNKANAKFCSNCGTSLTIV